MGAETLCSRSSHGYHQNALDNWWTQLTVVQKRRGRVVLHLKVVISRLDVRLISVNSSGLSQICLNPVLLFVLCLLPQFPRDLLFKQFSKSESVVVNVLCTCG